MSSQCAPACAAFGTTPQATLALNSTCACWPVDAVAVRQLLSPAVQATLGETHQHLFAATGVFLHAADLYAMQAQVRAIESVAQLPGYIASTGAEALQTGTRGALMGYDFHLTAAGPRLIEINTNAGGAFLARELQDILQLPCVASGDPGEKPGEMLQSEWLLAGRVGTPQIIAIVDDDPAAQYLHSDMQAAAELLRRWGAKPEDVQALAAIPQTTVVQSANADDLWSRRRTLFFKPAAGFGGRAAYRGAKLTKRVWRDIFDGLDGPGGPEGHYVAQQYVPPSVRRLPGSMPVELKYDVRLYTYAGESLGLVARLYNGQTTNFRTPGGGFAPVAVLGDQAAADIA